ncbi:MAG TPA: hypothetical protein ENI63_01815 [Candidatus Kaiserbacteria bacterium]|nr:hypothetical protein [Candidatus Kaiserbacteria bacterium]
MKSIKSKDWFSLERIQKLDMFQCYPVAIAICQNSKTKKFLGTKLKNIACITKDYTDLCFSTEEWNRVGKKYFQSLQKDFSICQKINKKIFQASKDLDKFSDKIYALKGDLPFGKLIKIYEDFLEHLKELYSAANFYEVLELGQKKYLTELLRSIIASHLDVKDIKKIDEYFPILTASRHPSWIEKERIDFLKLVAKLKSGTKINKDKLLKGHARKYFWIPSLGSFSIWDEKYFKKEIGKFHGNPLEEIENIKKKRGELISQQKNIENKLDLSRKEIDLFHCMQELSYLKDHRRGTQNKAFLVINLVVLQKMTDILGLKKNDINYLTLEEIKNLEGNKKHIEKRKKCWAYIIEDETKEKILEGPKELELFKEIIYIKPPKSKREIKGSVAYKGNIGKIKGVVKIVLGRKDINKIKKDEILVSHITNPDIMEAISKAKVIITDMGGITCHASIIAREMEKPCIIGTRVATETLKDGDLIEVDMNKGTVKILEDGTK